MTCRVTGGEHDWHEGGARDTGRYHCAKCQVCLYVDRLISDERKARAEVARLRAVITDLKLAAGCALYAEGGRAVPTKETP